jgi:hypothetical protein
MAAGGSLGEAAEFLGITSPGTAWPAAIYTMAGRVHVTARHQADPLCFDTALEALARELDDPATPLVNYQKRRKALENWYIDEDAWAVLAERLHHARGTPRPDFEDCLRQVASIYVWVQLTSGERILAPRPIESSQPPQIREAWKRWRRSTIWARMHRSPPSRRYSSLTAELDTLATSLAWTIDSARSQ